MFEIHNPKAYNKELDEKGYILFKNYFGEYELGIIEEYIHKFNNKHYKKQNLIKRIAYLREDSNNRQGDAYMITSDIFEELDMDYISLFDINLVKAYNLYNDITFYSTKYDVVYGKRVMMNIRQYFQNSFEVVEHFDGEFFDFEHKEKNGKNYLQINEGLLPRFVMVIVVYNENKDGKGVYLRDIKTNENHEFGLYGGDILMFDNLRFRHGVPSLKEKRMMVGFRNFDLEPYHFKREVTDPENWKELKDEYNPGFIKRISEKESIKLQKEFMTIQ